MQTPIGSASSATTSTFAGTSSLKAQLLHSLATGIEYRHEFVEEKVRTGLAVQAKSIREQRGMTQAELAKALHKSQSWVSRLEDPNKAIPTVPTLLLFARAFDVDLDVRFARFSQMLHRLSRLTPEGFQVPSFTDEYETGTLEVSTGDKHLESGQHGQIREVTVGAAYQQPLTRVSCLQAPA